MAGFVCRRCRTQAQKLSLPYRSFSSSSLHQANDPASALADIISPTKTARPETTPGPSSLPNEARDSSNPFLFPTGDDITKAGSTNPRPSNRPKGQSLHGHLNDFMKSGRNDAASLARLSETRERQAREKAALARRNAIESQMTRIWREGDVYAPRDLSPMEQMKAKQARAPARARDMRPINTRHGGGKDVLDDLGINPMKEYKNFKMMSEFVTEMGRIRHARDTGFRAVNQRKMAKAVRRAHGLGLLPTSYRHPELIPSRQDERRQL